MSQKMKYKRISSIEKGRTSEEIITNYLVSKKYKILERNFRTNFGEIDIIAEKNDYLIFIEVKSQFKRGGFLAEERINREKREKIFKVAKYFLIKNFGKLSKIKGIRFDVIVFEFPKGEIRHYESAFYQERDFNRY